MPSASAPAGVPQPGPIIMPQYELPPMTRQRHERAGRWMRFGQLPQTDAETAVALLLLCEITGEFDRLAYLYADGGGEACQIAIQDAHDNYANGLGYEWMRVDALLELAPGDLAAALNPETGWPLLQRYYEAAALPEGTSLEDYADAFCAEGGRIVQAQYTCGYTQLALQAGPQLPDGQRTVFYHLAPNADGNLVIYNDTLFTVELDPNVVQGQA